MAQEEHTSRCSNSSSGGGSGGGGGDGGGSSHRSSKKLKRKKVPQRGMGVAQLEKIISEELQKKDATVFTHNSIISSSSIPPPPPLPPNHHRLISRTDGVNPISASKPTNLISGGGNWCRLWSDGDYSFEGEKQSQSQNQNHLLDHHRYNPNPPIWPPPPNLMLQRSQHLQQPCSSSMVNVSTGTSSPSSSVLNLQMEPPSNQSYCGNNYHPLWPEEEKMVGMKRAYPFSLETMPIPSFHCKFPSAYVSPISRSDESDSCSNGGIASIEPAYSYFRENPSSAGAISDAKTKKFIDENQVLTRDFLKLAPPQASQSNSSSTENLYLSSQKGQPEDPSYLSGRGGSNLSRFLGFFPAARPPMGLQENSNGEAGESVDLNLKL